jgi:hypothetical protein
VVKATSSAVAIKPVRAVENTANGKLGLASATYATQASCPSDCPLLSGGCYAETAWVGVHTRRLNRSPVTDPAAVAEAEAREIDRLSGDRHLRLHVVGDCPTPAAARIVAAAARRYVRRGARKVWTYTHAWRRVSRANWSGVSVLASCETPGHVKEAHRRGYAAALIVGEHPADGRAYPLAGADGFKVVPCPQQTRAGVTCVSCRLCMDADRLHDRKLVIGFAAHGSAAGKVRFALEVLNG